MESGFYQADSRNLPVVDTNMVNDYFANNAKYISAEIRNVKTERAGRESYGDDAIGFVQIKRDEISGTCIVKAKITPEHRIHSSDYSLCAIINEKEEKITSCECLSCTASEGGCKHAVAFILWLHRRSEDPSVTSVTCYWKKSKLSSVGRSMKTATLGEMFNTGVPPLKIKGSSYVQKFISTGNTFKSSSLICKMYDESDIMKKISLHCLSLLFCKSFTNPNAEDFISFCKNSIKLEECKLIEEMTVSQNKTTKWYEARFGRITASKLFEASRCQTDSGVLVETILGATKITQTEAMKRGQRLEDDVLREIEKIKKIKINKCGLKIHPSYPIFGASPDGITEKYCVEVKCPSKKSTVGSYINENGKLCNKPWAQIQLQMFLFDKKHGLFVVADPDFENNKNIQIFEVNLDKNYCEKIMEGASNFWKRAVFPKLIN